MKNYERMGEVITCLEEECAKAKVKTFLDPIKKVQLSAETIGKSWSGSWIGYHSRVYYLGFSDPPAGALFSVEWGLRNCFVGDGSVGDWVEFKHDDVLGEIYKRCRNPDFSNHEAITVGAREVFEKNKAITLSLITVAKSNHAVDLFLDDLYSKIEKLKIYDASNFVTHLRPSSVRSRDSLAMQGGLCVPPHIGVLARMFVLMAPFEACNSLKTLVSKVALHLENIEKQRVVSGRTGTNVFIGHGRSAMWKDLRDFIRDRVHLPWDEFNRVPIAGITNITRLSQMLDSAAIAFLIMTAEDEQNDGKLYARQNVIHEAGLFQGRLGFQRAIILLEEGCEEFSNINGLGQIRFPRGNIATAFEEIRQVLEREEIVTI